VTEPAPEQRRSTTEKILPVLDVIYAILGAVLAMFGRRTSDR
jgi:hypothetical protein